MILFIVIGSIVFLLTGSIWWGIVIGAIACLLAKD
jgi:uncharacterized membrane protein